MKITPHIHQQLNFKNRLLTLVLLLFIAFFAWLTQRYSVQYDLTDNSSQTLSSASQVILSQVSGEVSITVYTHEPTLQHQVEKLLQQYLRFKENIKITFLDPNLQAETARSLNINAQGAVVVEYMGRTKVLDFFNEASLSNALLQLSHTEQRWIGFLSGHGERSVFGRNNADLGMFTSQLESHHVKTQVINLAKISVIPEEIALLVIASPTTMLLPVEINVISDYIDKGGNLLLLAEPENRSLVSLELMLGIQRLPGTLIDISSGLYGVDNPSFILISEYSNHAATYNFESLSIFPMTAAFSIIDEEGQFQVKTLFSSTENAWTETGDLTQNPQFDADSDEQQGVLPIALALTRTFSDQKSQQRIIVMGDSDWLSNAFLGHVGNAELGLRIVNWLTHDDQFIEIPLKRPLGQSLNLTATHITLIASLFLAVIPFTFVLIGFFIWHRRKKY